MAGVPHSPTYSPSSESMEELDTKAHKLGESIVYLWER
jgi:hypothetical protein